MAVSTFFPDADPETTSVDGYAQQRTNQTWATKRADAGSHAFDTSTSAEAPSINTSTDSALPWATIGRAIFLFDTTSLPDGDTIDSATFELVATSKRDQYVQSFSMVTSTPASNTAVAIGDYAQLGTTKQAADVTIASITADSATYNAWTLNATGRNNISKTDISKFGLRITGDNDNVEPGPWVSDTASAATFAFAEEILAGDKRPKLVVTHTAPPSTFVPKMLAF